MHVSPKQNILEQWEMKLIYHTRVELQKHELETGEQRRKNKLNLPQFQGVKKKKDRKLFTKSNAQTKNLRESHSHTEVTWLFPRQYLF